VAARIRPGAPGLTFVDLAEAMSLVDRVLLFAIGSDSKDQLLIKSIKAMTARQVDFDFDKCILLLFFFEGRCR